MQDCNKQDESPIKGTAHCMTFQPTEEPSVIVRGCIGSQDAPEWDLPEPPLGGAVCIDHPNGEEVICE